MNAVEYISKNMNARKILDHYNFRDIVETDDSIRSCCEIHNGNNPTAFVWNKQNNLWYCYTSDCGGGDVFTLIEKLEKVGFTKAVAIVASILELDITGLKVEKQTDLVINNTKKWIEFMKKKNQVILSDVPYELPNTKYYDDITMLDRFDTSLTNFYEAKYCRVYPTEEGFLYNKLVIPIYFMNILRGVALRDTTGKYQPKWMFQPKSLPIRCLLYNYDAAMQCVRDSQTSEIILVEGVFDVWAYHRIGIDNVVGIFGSSLKQEQKALLLKTGLDIVTSFDNDDAGNKCTKDVIQYFKYKATVKTVQFPIGKDPGDCTPDELKEYYLQRS